MRVLIFIYVYIYLGSNHLHSHTVYFSRFTLSTRTKDINNLGLFIDTIIEDQLEAFLSFFSLY